MGGATVSISASRTAGVAPLGVFFEAVVENAGVDYPFHELLYEWDFGYSAGTFSYGNTLYNEKRYATGPRAAHVFSESGAALSATVTLTVKRRRSVLGVQTTEVVGTATQAITATGSVAEFDVEGKLLLVHATATVGSHPFSNADTTEQSGTISLATFNGWKSSGYRAILFRHGESFTLAGNFDPSASDGPFLIGAYNAANGDKPVLTSANANYTFNLSTNGNDDPRIVGVQIDNSSTGAGIRITNRVDHFLFLNVDTGDVGSHSFLAGASSPNIQTNGLPEYGFIHGCTTGNGTTQGGRAFSIDGKFLSVQGNSLDASQGSTTHTYRGGPVAGGVIAHNTFTHPSSGSSGQVHLKLQGHEPGEAVGDPDLAYLMIQDNIFTGGSLEPVHITAADGDGDERLHDIIFERNWLHSLTEPNNIISVADAARVTIRNNVAYIADADPDATQDTYMLKVDDGLDGSPTGVWFYNNTYVMLQLDGAGDDEPTVAEMVRIFAGVTAGTVHASNNLFYRPGSAAFMREDVAAGTDSNNLATSTNPIGTSPPTAITHYRLGSGSAAIDGGGEVAGLFADYERVALPDANSEVSIGAFQTDPA